MFFEIWSSIFLLVCAVIDFKTRKVYQSICIFNYIIAIGIKLLLSQFDLKSWVFGFGLCVVLFVVSLVTKESIGRGDVLIILTLTGILKVENVIDILFMSLFLCSAFSVVMLLMKKLRLKNALPFVPFLLVGNLLWIALEGKYV